MYAMYEISFLHISKTLRIFKNLSSALHFMFGEGERALSSNFVEIF